MSSITKAAMRWFALLLLIAFASPPLPAQTTKPAQTTIAATGVPTGAATTPPANPHLALSRRINDIKFTGVALVDAIDYLRQATGANVHVNWRALEQVNITRETKVSLHLSDITARRMLRSLLDETGAGSLITYYVDENVIEITTRAVADSVMITRVYPVDDLVMQIPDFSGPTLDLENQGTQASGSGGGGSSGQSLFGANGAANAAQAQGKTQQASDLVKLITQTIRPEIWRDNGGTASIRYFNGHLIVTAPRSVQQAISGISD